MIGVYERNNPQETSRKLQELKEMQALPLEKKISLSRSIIEKALKIDEGRAVILYSGGKDSTVLLHLVTKIKKDVLVVFNNTNLINEKVLIQLRKNVKNFNFIETIAEDPVKMWNKRGHYPLLAKRQFTEYKKNIKGFKSSPVQCCYNLKEKPLNNVLKKRSIKVLFWGNRADESNRRKLNFVDNGFIKKLKNRDRYNVYPLQHWNEKNIKKYLYENSINLKILDTGCIVCGTGIKHSYNNLHKLYKNNYKKWLYYMRCGMGIEILRANNIKPELLETIIKENPGILCQIKKVF
jgi:3'-phosphoadenosine 5'-phosphosulfate sulfotransferase (PAPS reductase)/FAD synthetase